jgi:putative membrane protein
VKKLLLLATIALPWAMGPALAQNQIQRTEAAQGQTGTGPGITHNPVTPVQGSRRAASGAETLTTSGFVHMASVSDQYEIQAAQLAMQRSQNQEVKNFAQRMATDHETTTRQLQGLVQNISSVQVTTALDAKHTEMLTQLRNARGSDFDRLYMTQQIQAHQNAVDLFHNYSQAGDNAQLKQWASATLPKLQEHLQMAQQTQRQLGHS